MLEENCQNELLEPKVLLMLEEDSQSKLHMLGKNAERKVLCMLEQNDAN